MAIVKFNGSLAKTFPLVGVELGEEVRGVLQLGVDVYTGCGYVQVRGRRNRERECPCALCVSACVRA